MIQIIGIHAEDDCALIFKTQVMTSTSDCVCQDPKATSMAHWSGCVGSRADCVRQFPGASILETGIHMLLPSELGDRVPK